MKLFKKAYYEKLMATEPKTVRDYQYQISVAQEKIKELQAKCEHINFKVMFNSWRPGAMQPARICDSCAAVVPGITEEESQKLWDAHGRITQSGVVED